MDFDQNVFDHACDLAIYHNRAIAAPLAIWAICSAIVVLFAIHSIRRHFDLIRTGVFLTYLSWTFALAMGAYERLVDNPPMMVAAPLVVWLMASVGAFGSVILIKGLMRRNV